MIHLTPMHRAASWPGSSVMFRTLDSRCDTSND